MPRQSTKPRTRRRFTDDERQDLVRRFADSGLTMHAFAAKNGVSETSIAKWRRLSRLSKRPISKPAFVEIEALSGGECSANSIVCELETRGGLKLHLRRGFDGAEVAALVRALG